MNSNKYKLLGGSALLLLAVSPVIATGILSGLSIIVPFPALIISAIACSATIFLGLAFAVAISNLNQKKIETEKFFQDLEVACEAKDSKKVEAMLKKPSLLSSSKKKIKNFIEKQGEDEFGTPLLHKIILSGESDILAWLCENMPDLNWNAQNKNDQTILHRIAEEENDFLANEFCSGKCTKIIEKLDLSIKDISEKTAKMITSEKQKVKDSSHSAKVNFAALYEALESKAKTPSARADRS